MMVIVLPNLVKAFIEGPIRVNGKIFRCWSAIWCTDRRPSKHPKGGNEYSVWFGVDCVIAAIQFLRISSSPINSQRRELIWLMPSKNILASQVWGRPIRGQKASIEAVMERYYGDEMISRDCAESEFLLKEMCTTFALLFSRSNLADTWKGR